MGAAALRYAERGWAVLPVAGMVDGRCGCARPCDRPAKHPLSRHGLLDATTDAATIRGWWARHPGANIGVATGASGLVVIDVDMPDGERSLGRLDALGLHRAPTLVGLTGGGGRHLVYAAAAGGGAGGLHNTARGLPGVGEALPDIDLRAQGGYIVAPPSMHASGARYRWEDPARAVAAAPGWLQPITVAVAHAGPRPALGPLPTTGAPATAWSPPRASSPRWAPPGAGPATTSSTAAPSPSAGCALVASSTVGWPWASSPGWPRASASARARPRPPSPAG